MDRAARTTDRHSPEPSPGAGPLTALRRRLPRRLAWVAGLAALGVAVPAVVASVDGDALGRATRAAAGDPAGMALAVGTFAAAFGLRAVLWHRLLPSLGAGHAWAALHVSLAANHLLPLRLGEGARVVSVVRRAGVGLAPATASTVALRSADMVTVALIAAALAPATAMRILGAWGLAVVALVAVAGVVAARHLGRAAASGAARRLDAVAVAGSAAAWLLEGAVVWQAARWTGIDLSPSEALLVTAVAVTAQVAAIAPGGFGTYEAASVAAYATLGIDPAVALAAALVAHAVKTAYSFLAGAVAVVVPAPSMLGRLRLLPRGDRPAPQPETGGPVVLFLPARNEAPRVGAVIRRAPASVQGRPVVVVVVDDGSTDGTADEARSAGAEVVTLPGSGLGAAVSAGLREAVDRRAAAVAFCDADGEYDPAELHRLVAPILAGDADYVVGSRFAGDIRHMRPHRRLGNRVLTRVLAFIARQPVTDGQSGYRALSPSAAAAAEVIHDFNYAQVLTLDLLAKGYRYAEVPITYAFRTSGDSFVRLVPYLRRVAPAVWRELNTA